MSKKSPIRRIFRIFLGVILGIVLLLLTTVTVILVTPGARTAVLNKCVKEVNERTDWDVDLGRLYLSPFHHSPMTLYHAYKGTEDLPLHIEIDSLFIGHRGLDTLICVQAMRFQGNLHTDRTIVVDQLLLKQTTFHSDTLIATIGRPLRPLWGGSKAYSHNNES